MDNKREKFYYIKVKEYIKDSINIGFFDSGYFDKVTIWIGGKKTEYVLDTVSDKKYAKRYKYKAWAEKKINEVYALTKKLENFYPYEDNIYKYKFEIVCEE